MKYDSAKDKIKTTKTIEVEVDPITEITEMARKHYRNCDINNFKLIKSSGKILVKLVASNKEWSNAVLRACIEFSEKYDAYISGLNDYDFNFAIQMK